MAPGILERANEPEPTGSVGVDRRRQTELFQGRHLVMDGKNGSLGRSSAKLEAPLLVTWNEIASSVRAL
jgi:hypothetical protein